MGSPPFLLEGRGTWRPEPSRWRTADADCPPQESSPPPRRTPLFTQPTRHVDWADRPGPQQLPLNQARDDRRELGPLPPPSYRDDPRGPPLQKTSRQQDGCRGPPPQTRQQEGYCGAAPPPPPPSGCRDDYHAAPPPRPPRQEDRRYHSYTGGGGRGGDVAAVAYPPAKRDKGMGANLR